MAPLWVTLLMLLTCCALAHAQAVQDPLVQLEKGAARGTAFTIKGGRSILAFRGIPYARPPVGKYRFREPKPMKPWQGVWDATRFQSECLQYERNPVFGVHGDEDCLYVNVYTPRLPTAGSALMDVAVFIHGGGFMYGGGQDWGPDHLLDKHNVILVTFNYRLGVLGFLSTEDEVVPGNNGLKDQSAALRWVRGNIAAFGGNPNSVTLFGLSAGGASVHFHYLSPLSAGLFARGWSLSGSALLCWTQQEAAREKALRLGEMLGCPTNATRDLVDCLKHRPARALVSRVPDFQDEFEHPFTPFSSVVEPAPAPGAVGGGAGAPRGAPFLDKSPIDVIRSGEAQDLPWMTGVTTEEGLYTAAEFIGDPAKLASMDANWLKVAPLLLDYNLTVADADKDAVSAAVKRKYLGDQPVGPATTPQIIKMVGDRIFSAGVEQSAREMAAANSQPVYFYEFGYRGSGNGSLSAVLSGGDPTDWGVSHADDIPYLLKWDTLPAGDTPSDLRVAKQLISVLTTFMRTGVPSGVAGSPVWAPIDPAAAELQMIKFTRDGALSFTTVPQKQIANSDFWESLPIQENIPSPEAEAEGGHDEL